MSALIRAGLRQGAALWAIALVPAILAALFHPRRALWNPDTLSEGEVSLEQALAWGESAIWLDARSRSDYEAAHVPGALLLNEDEWHELLEDFIMLESERPGAPIVVYCDSRECGASKDVAERLRGEEFRFQNVHVLHGGWKAWREAQGEQGGSH